MRSGREPKMLQMTTPASTAPIAKRATQLPQDVTCISRLKSLLAMAAARAPVLPDRKRRRRHANLFRRGAGVLEDYQFAELELEPGNRAAIEQLLEQEQQLLLREILFRQQDVNQR